MTLRIVFMGSPAFAVPTLRVCHELARIVAVVTQPDKPAGRGQKLHEPAVKLAAHELGLTVWQPRSVRTADFTDKLRALDADLAVVVAYGKILPRAILDACTRGCVNVHASLLPKYRGAAPIQWAIINGETQTGCTIMQLDEGMDTGPMLRKSTLAIGGEETAGELGARLATLGATLLGEVLRAADSAPLATEAQDPAQASLAPLLCKDDGRVDWTRAAPRVGALIRGVDPWPGATTQLGQDTLKMWGARVVAGRGVPGRVLGFDGEGLCVACADGAVVVSELQLPGKKRMPARALAAGHALNVGTQLG